MPIQVRVKNGRLGRFGAGRGGWARADRTKSPPRTAATMEGTMSMDWNGSFSAGRDSISDGTMDYWGQSARTVASVTGQRTQDSGWPVGLEADQVQGARPRGSQGQSGTISKACGCRDTGAAMCDSPGRDPYHAHWGGLLEAPLSLDGPPPCMTLSGRAATSQSQRFADSRATLRVDERASFSVGFEHIE